MMNLIINFKDNTIVKINNVEGFNTTEDNQMIINYIDAEKKEVVDNDDTGELFEIYDDLIDCHLTSCVPLEDISNIKIN